MMESLSENHQSDLKKCDLHLCYLGRGIFMELVKCEVPLQVVDDNKPNVHSLIIGELTTEENLTYDELSHLGLGAAIDHTQAVQKCESPPDSGMDCYTDHTLPGTSGTSSITPGTPTNTALCSTVTVSLE